jgi:pimeloyl-[acyl-carrier protein] methyl ester esterase
VSDLHVHVEGHGRDLVLLHGWGFHSAAWNGAAQALASRHRVHRIDLPGHGRSGECRVPDFDAAIERVARHVPRRSLIAGWSLGGLFAQRLAASGHAAGLVLMGATPCFVARDGWPDAMRATTLEAFARELETDAARTLEQFVRLNALDGARARETVRAMLQCLRDAPMAAPDGLRDGLRWLRDTDLRASTSRLEIPCVILHGARDRITPVGAARWLAREIRGAHLIELADAAHLPFATHAERFVEAVEMLGA